MERTVIFFTT